MQRHWIFVSVTDRHKNSVFFFADKVFASFVCISKSSRSHIVTGILVYGRRPCMKYMPKQLYILEHLEFVCMMRSNSFNVYWNQTTEIKCFFENALIRFTQHNDCWRQYLIYKFCKRRKSDCNCLSTVFLLSCFFFFFLA